MSSSELHHVDAPRLRFLRSMGGPLFSRMQDAQVRLLASDPQRQCDAEIKETIQPCNTHTPLPK